MPLVTIYRRNFSVDYVSLIKKAVREVGASALSVAEWPISEESFSFVNHIVGNKGDEMLHDAIVVIPVHNFSEREAMDEDAICRSIKERITHLINKCGLTPKNIEVMVGMYKLGWSGEP